MIDKKQSTPYPDLDLIKRLRQKFIEYTVHSLSVYETVDLINHQNERIRGLERRLKHKSRIAQNLYTPDIPGQTKED